MVSCAVICFVRTFFPPVLLFFSCFFVCNRERADADSNSLARLYLNQTPRATRCHRLRTRATLGTLILLVRTVGVVGEVSTALLSSPNELELNESDGAGMGVGGTREGKEQGATEETASVATASLKRRKVGKQVKELGGPMKMSVQLVNLRS